MSHFLSLKFLRWAATQRILFHVNKMRDDRWLWSDVKRAYVVFYFSVPHGEASVLPRMFGPGDYDKRFYISSGVGDVVV